MKASSIIGLLLESVVYLANPRAEEWDPSILGLAGKPLKVAHASDNKVVVYDPDGGFITFHAAEVSDVPTDKASVRTNYYASMPADIDHEEGDREHDTIAAKSIETDFGEWRAFSNSEAKLNAIRQLKFHPTIRMNSLRRLYSELKMIGKANNFQSFMVTPIKVYRGSNMTKDNPISVTWDPSKTLIFGSSHSAMVSPDSMVYYIGGPEREILVPRNVFTKPRMPV